MSLITSIFFILPILSIVAEPLCPNSTLIYFRHQDCSKFYECSGGDVHLFRCPPGEHFNLEMKRCDFTENVECETTTTTTINPPKLNKIEAIEEAFANMEDVNDNMY